MTIKQALSILNTARLIEQNRKNIDSKDYAKYRSCSDQFDLLVEAVRTISTSYHRNEYNDLLDMSAIQLQYGFNYGA